MAWLGEPTCKQLARTDSMTARAWTLGLFLGLSACSDRSASNAQETGETGEGDGDTGDSEPGDGDGEPEPPCEEWIIQFGSGSEERVGNLAFDGEHNLYVSGSADCSTVSTRSRATRS